MITILMIVLGAMMIAGALLAVYMKNLTGAVIASGSISLIASLMYLIMSAPDVAMTEAAIGSGLTTVVFLFALSRMRGKKEEPRD